MKMLKTFAFAAIAACCTGALADVAAETSVTADKASSSNTTLSEKDVADVNESVKVRKRGRRTSAKNLVEKDINDYFEGMGISPGVPDKSGNVYFSGIARVERNVKDPAFIKSRALAFDKAYQSALAKYVMDKFGREVLESERTYFNDQSIGRLAPAAEVKNATTRIVEKAALLAEAELDGRLREMGKTPSGSIVEKRKLFVDSIMKKSMARAVGSSSGVLPVQSFEGWTDNGKYAVGVALRGGLVTEEVASCLREKQMPKLARPTGMSVREAIPGDEELPAQFGVRLFFDETGTPALLGFGQWGVSYAGTDEDMLDRAEESARKQAERAANEVLTQFINSTISVSEESERAETVSSSALFDDEGNVSEEGVKNLIDRVREQSTMRGSDSMIGRSTPKPAVIVDHPSGHAVAVCVRMWSFGQYDAMKRVVDRNAERPSGRTPAQRKFGESGSGTRRGRSFDF